MCDVWDRDIEDPITIGDYTSTASTHYLPRSSRIDLTLMIAPDRIRSSLDRRRSVPDIRHH